jgi:hypothetical protein
MDKIVNRTLAKWAAEKLNEMPRIKRLIGLAKWCLHYGPNMEGQDDGEDDEKGLAKWPGFEDACREIASAVEPLCQDLWIGIQFEEVLTSEPQPDSYEDANPDYDPDDEDSEEFVTVTNEVCWEDYSKVDSRQVKGALLGELAEYCN